MDAIAPDRLGLPTFHDEFIYHIREKVACRGGRPTALILLIAAMGRLLAFAVIGGCRLSGSSKGVLPPFINSPAINSGVVNPSGSLSKIATHPLCPEPPDDIFMLDGRFHHGAVGGAKSERVRSTSNCGHSRSAARKSVEEGLSCSFQQFWAAGVCPLVTIRFLNCGRSVRLVGCI